MKLYVTPTSPYARLAMIVRLELGLADDIELVWTKSRIPDDPMLIFNPSGRIPFLHLDNGSGFEDTDLIVEYLDLLGPQRRFARPEPADVGADAYWEFRRQEMTARSVLDGASVWGRELVRPRDEQSPGIIAHERARALRLADVFDDLVGGDILTGPLNLPQLLLFCALNLEFRLPEFDWRQGHPALDGWFDRIQEIPSVRNSVPPPTA
jgi:glutathione S-transferase